MLSSKEKEVTKVPYFSSRERGREREKERGGEGERKKKELVSSLSMRKQCFVAINLLGK